MSSSSPSLLARYWGRSNKRDKPLPCQRRRSAEPRAVAAPMSRRTWGRLAAGVASAATLLTGAAYVLFQLTCLTPEAMRAPGEENREELPVTTRMRLWACGLAASALHSAGCAGAPMRPWARDCPQEAWDNMQKLGLAPVIGSFFWVTTDVTQPGYLNESAIFRTGPIVSQVFHAPPDSLPKNSLVYGYMWTETRKVHAHHDKVRLPDGREYAVCFVLGFDENGGRDVESGDEPGTVRLPRRAILHMTRRFISPE